MDPEDGAASTKAVVPAAEEYLPDPQQREGAGTHDARLARHIQLTPGRRQIFAFSSDCRFQLKRF